MAQAVLISVLKMMFIVRSVSAGKGRVEVVTCDGRFRRILLTGLERVGPLALDITRG